MHTLKNNYNYIWIHTLKSERGRHILENCLFEVITKIRVQVFGIHIFSFLLFINFDSILERKSCHVTKLKNINNYYILE
jgi:hypothetical protein